MITAIIWGIGLVIGITIGLIFLTFFKEFLLWAAGKIDDLILYYKYKRYQRGK